jgi:hypothetical protein
MASSWRRGTLVRSLPITLGDNLPGDALRRGLTSSVVWVHVDTTTGGRRKHLQQLKVDLGIMDMHEGQRNQSSTAQMLSNEGVDSSTVLETFKQRWQTVRLVVQRKHGIMHQSKGTSTRFGHDPSLSDPIPKKHQLHRLRPIRPEIVSNRIGVRLSSKKVRIHTSSFSSAVEAHICRKR